MPDMKPFPLNDKPIRLAMLGMVDGNGHPYSWSAIINGYRRELMKDCPYPGILTYLFREPASAFGIPGVQVTHIWTDDPADAEKVAAASCVPEVCAHPEDVIGKVDAVIVATDKGFEHVARCRPFVEAGLPIFVDKPMVDNLEDLRVFCRWVDKGAVILSTSCMRYAKEYAPYRLSTHDLGSLRYLNITMAKSWERYGIHALEALYPIVGPGFVAVRNVGEVGRDIVVMEHECGAMLSAAVIGDMSGGFGHMLLAGTEGSVSVKMSDTFYCFRAQLAAFVNYLRTGDRPFPFDETVELMKLLIAGIISRKEHGRRILLDDLTI
ncbi:hypothetical protein AGMMS49992_15610 [Clostridia bacterium]|nr:hypothetical protein AGMMS49992_15610 [Clostridia bacterium]